MPHPTSLSMPHPALLSFPAAALFGHRTGADRRGADGPSDVAQPEDSGDGGYLLEEMSRAMALGAALPSNYDLLSLMPSVRQASDEPAGRPRTGWLRRFFTRG